MDVGDIIAQVDPVHIGLPWAGIRLVLLVSAFLCYIGAQPLDSLIAFCSSQFRITQPKLSFTKDWELFLSLYMYITSTRTTTFEVATLCKAIYLKFLKIIWLLSMALYCFSFSKLSYISDSTQHVGHARSSIPPSDDIVSSYIDGYGDNGSPANNP